ncbi:MAG: helix-turn-helix domain-containing protein [Lachnospiraceae bacterium]|nr:helix-turn-helix domain-containing protein [Lachnospiraceae bacterium]
MATSNEGSICKQNRIGMTVDEAASYTGIGRNTLRQLINSGKLPVLRIGRKNIIRTDVLEHFLQINEGVNLLDINQVRNI